MALVIVGVLLALVVAFPGGQAVVTDKDDTQHVVIRGLDNVVASDSYCDASSGRYVDIVRFGQAVVHAAKINDRAALSSLMQYPLRVNRGSIVHGIHTVKTEYIDSRATLLKRYSSVFSSAVLERLRQIEPHDVFCRNGMSSLDAGLLWADVDKAGRVRAAVLNQ